MHKLVPSQRGWLILAWAIIGAPFCICALLLAAVFVPQAIRGASPPLYPGVQAVTSDGSPGSYGVARTYTYIVTLPLADIQHYYEDQMSRYCQSSWQFEELTACEGNAPCHTAWCEIPRHWLGQAFFVGLYPIS